MYEYTARLEKVIDGDTCDLMVDLGFHVEFHIRCRLFGINTPERGKPLWLEAKEALWMMLAHRDFIIRTHKDRTEKYGRYLVEIYYRVPDNPELVYVNEELVKRGLAVRYMADAA